MQGGRLTLVDNAALARAVHAGAIAHVDCLSRISVAHAHDAHVLCEGVRRFFPGVESIRNERGPTRDPRGKTSVPILTVLAEHDGAGVNSASLRLDLDLGPGLRFGCLPGLAPVGGRPVADHVASA